MPRLNCRLLVRSLSVHTGGFIGYFALVLVVVFLRLLPLGHLSYAGFAHWGLSVLLPSLFSYAFIVGLAPILPRWAMPPLALAAYLLMLPTGVIVSGLLMGEGWSWGNIIVRDVLGLILFWWPLLIPDLILAIGMKVRAPRMPADKKPLTD